MLLAVTIDPLPQEDYHGDVKDDCEYAYNPPCGLRLKINSFLDRSVQAFVAEVDKGFTDLDEGGLHDAFLAA